MIKVSAELDIVPANAGTPHTLRGKGQEFIVNQTFISATLARKVVWHVCEFFPFSDHQAISVCINKNRVPSRMGEKLS